MLGKLFKWLVIPAIIAAIGYYIVGPSLGADVLKKVPAIEKILPQEATKETPEPSDEAPEVEISVRPTDRG